MARTVTVKVTGRDIAHGQWGNCANCPVARAITRAMGEDWRTDGWGAWPVFNPSSRRLALPAEAQQFIQSFDLSIGREGEPFAFPLTVPWME